MSCYFNRFFIQSSKLFCPSRSDTKFKAIIIAFAFHTCLLHRNKKYSYYRKC